MPLILAVDTTHGTCSVAIGRDGKILHSFRNNEAGRQAELLVTLIEEALLASSMSYRDLTLLVATVGPGSFTGLRIGLSAISGMSIASGVPKAGLSTLEVMAWQAMQAHTITTPIAVILDAMRGQVYLQLFTIKDAYPVPATEPALVAIENIASALPKNCTLVGNYMEAIAGTEAYPAVFTRDLLPDAKHMIGMAAAALAGKHTLLPALPLYIRPPDAKLPKPKS